MSLSPVNERTRAHAEANETNKTKRTKQTALYTPPLLFLSALRGRVWDCGVNEGVYLSKERSGRTKKTERTC